LGFMMMMWMKMMMVVVGIAIDLFDWWCYSKGSFGAFESSTMVPM
jgi:hypothetical protein